LALSELSELSCRHCTAQAGPTNICVLHVLPQLVTSAVQAVAFA